MSLYTHNLEELIVFLSCNKFRLTTHLKKNYRENIHYIIEYNKHKSIINHGVKKMEDKIKSIIFLQNTHLN